MKIIYSPLHKKHNPSYEVYEGEQSSYPEVPDRIEGIAHELRNAQCGEFVSVKSFGLHVLSKIHHPNYICMLQKRSDFLAVKKQAFASYFITDTYAPVTKGTYQAAKEAVDCALTGAELVKNGEALVYSLCRPPGHHADKFSMGGYCYFNNAAAAAEYLSQCGRVAILDIDYHHGNGTQSMFYDRNDVLYISLHADPNEKYPYISGYREEIGIGEGKGFNKNYPLPIEASGKLYRQTLSLALKDVKEFNPDFLIVSAGFDTYIKDPIGGLNLTIPFYSTIGKDISMLQVPTLIVQEGGYFVEDLGKIATSLLKGFL